MSEFIKLAEVEADEVECTLCNLCLEGCEVDAITIHKL